jgi:hypothetical protein
MTIRSNLTILRTLLMILILNIKQMILVNVGRLIREKIQIKIDNLDVYQYRLNDEANSTDHINVNLVVLSGLDYYQQSRKRKDQIFVYIEDKCPFFYYYVE